MEELLDNASENHFFLKIDLKSACHQVLLKEEDERFIFFEVQGTLYEFNRLHFGVTNAVLASQKFTDNFVD